MPLNPSPNPDNRPDLIRQRIDTCDWTRVRQDVQPFLERAEDRALLSQETLTDLLRQAKNRQNT